MKTHCVHGHAYTEANTLWYTNTNNKKRYYQCKRCKYMYKSKYARDKYNQDEEYRLKEIARVRAGQLRRKQREQGIAV